MPIKRRRISLRLFQESGRRGGQRRAKVLSKKRQSEIGKLGAKVRWTSKRKKVA